MGSATRGALRILALGSALWAPPALAAGMPDSSHVRFELGFSTDLTNEQYFEESYTDTTFQARTLRDLPERRSAGVAAMEWALRGGSGTWGLWWRPEVSIGDKVRRASAAGRVVHMDGTIETWSLEPRVEWREDESFDLERREWRAALDLRHRRAMQDFGRLDLVVGGEWSDASGEDVSLLLDRRVARAALRWSHTPMFGWEWGMRASADARAFPDSIARDHLEAEWSAEARRLFGDAHQFSASLALAHREALHPTESTRDRFWAPRASLALDLRSADVARLHWYAEGEALRYRDSDPAVYFDYEVLRTRLELEKDIGGGVALRVGPRLEWLLSVANASERYTQSGVGLEFERFSLGHWWSVGPEAGWRQYERETDTVITAPGLHSSFAYYGIQALAEFTLASGWRTRLLADARIEKHRDASQDARSLYFSLDVRRLLAPS